MVPFWICYPSLDKNKTVIHGVDLEVPSNRISVIIGSNGCGKSTLLKTLARLIKPTSGNIVLDGKPLGKIPPKQLARVIGLLPPSPISGGQRQRVWIAMALAQQTDILFLDEPSTFLDITYQVEILDLLTDLNRKHGTTIVMVLHDINLSARYADHIFALNKGKLVAEDEPSRVITSALVNHIFALDCAVIQVPVSGSPMVVPKGRHHVHQDWNQEKEQAR